MKNLRKIILLILIINIFSTACFASVIGTEIDGYTLPVAEGTYFTRSVSYSDQSGVGKQTENYLVYSPNDSVKPIITYGDYIYGAGRTSEEIAALVASGKNPVAGANADFFSFQTGVPMSDLIIDGRIVTKDGTEQYGIGFMEDGSAFISKFAIFSSMVKEDGTETFIYNINKFRQPYSIYLMTDQFSTETKNSSIGVDVVLSVVEGDMKLGSEMTAVVESLTENKGSIPIPRGKILLTVDNNAPTEFYQALATLVPGEMVTFKFGVMGDARWKDVKLGMGAVGGMLLSGGEINPNLENGAAPRTAIGITKDGKVLLYTIDGRQPGYSYGVQLRTLAARMKELGCVDAINLDGGGSTTFAAALPGMPVKVVNSPSEGSERKVSTFIFFENLKKPTGKAAELFVYPRTSYLLTDGKVQLETRAVDENFYPAQLPEKPEYFVEEGKGSVSEDGVFTAEEGGKIKVTAKSGELSGDVIITCLKTPTDIHVLNKETGKILPQITLKRGETLSLSAKAFGGYNELISGENSFSWSVEGEAATISAGNLLVGANSFGKEGVLSVTAGEKTVSIPISLVKNGKETEEGTRFDISAEVTDGILSGTLSSEYDVKAESVKIFADGKEIPCRLADNKFTADVPENTHKITIYATSTEKYTDLKYIYLDAVGTRNNPFADTETNWARDILSFMYEKKIISGENTDEGLLFRPQKQMTRAEFAVICSNYLGVDLSEYSDREMPFTDDVPMWAQKQLKALYYMGIFKGRLTDDGVMADPNSSITRAEAATIISRLMPDGLKKSAITAQDKADIPGWAVEAMERLFA
ncbi:MAG: phosphodiester glycosidase family protein, partial [Monoglobales bacterium]